MNAVRAKLVAEEDGVVLMLVLGFLALIGVMVVALANYATTNLSATNRLRELRAVQVTGGSAVDGAINTVRFNPPLVAGPPVNCFSTSLNGQSMQVGCSLVTVAGQPANQQTVEFTATLTSAARVVAVADATFDRSDPFNVTVHVDKWSVTK